MTLFHSPSVQSPKAYDLQNLQAAQLGTRLAAGANAALRGNLRTALQDSAYLYKIHPSETAAGLVDANLTFGFEVGDVRRYGADPTGAADSTTAFKNAYAAATAAGGLLLLTIPGGNYTIAGSTPLGAQTAGLVWSVSFLHVRATGQANLTFTHASLDHLIAIDGGSGGGTRLEGVAVEGWPKLIGNATTTNAWFVRACHHSHMQLRAGDCLVALRTNWCVCTTFDQFTCSINEAAFTLQVPAVGIWLDELSGLQTAFCNIDRPVLEGITSVNGQGILFASTLGCQVKGGTSEGNRIGLSVSGSNNTKNIVIGMDFESNTQNDVTLSGGQAIEFYHCSFSSLATANPNIDVQVAITGLTFYGGFIRWINMQVDNACFFGVRFSNGGSVGLKNNGHAYKSVSSILVDGSELKTGDVPDSVGESGTFTPTIFGATTAGAQTYTQQKGYFQRVGHVVHFVLVIQLSANGGGAGTARISLNGGAAPPPPSRNQTLCTHSFAVCNYTGVTLGAAGRQLSATMAAAGLTMDLLETDTGSVSNSIAITAVGATAIINISGSYLTD